MELRHRAAQVEALALSRHYKIFRLHKRAEFCIIYEWHLLSCVFYVWPIWLNYRLIIVLTTETIQKIGKYEMISPAGTSELKQRHEKHEVWLKLRFDNEDKVIELCW